MKRSYFVSLRGLAYLVTLPTETAEASITLKSTNRQSRFSQRKQVYAQNCASCHGVDGLEKGKRIGLADDYMARATP